MLRKPLLPEAGLPASVHGNERRLKKSARTKKRAQPPGQGTGSKGEGQVKRLFCA